jgi:2-polyprenyl-3-methyl-5-hydroxy-6-metoxy-1,4-benzoquinol methylase
MEMTRMDPFQLIDFLITNTDLGERVEYLVNPIRMYHYIVARAAGRGSHPNRVLDVGCSSGYGTFILSHGLDQANVVGVDIEEEKLEDARRLFGTNGVDFRRLDILDSAKVLELVEEGGRFDVVVCLEVLEHIPRKDSEDMLRNLAELLKGGGLLFISTPNRDIYDIGAFTEDHVNEVRYEDLLDLLRSAGFSVLDTKGIQEKSKVSSSLLMRFGLVERVGDRRTTLGGTARFMRRIIILLFDWRTSLGFLLGRLSRTKLYEWKYRTALNSTPEWSVAVLATASTEGTSR